MIEDVVSTLGEAGLITEGYLPRFNIEITRGDSVVVYAYLPANRFIHIKASESGSSYRTYQAHEAAWKALPAYVPRPLGFHSRGGWEFALTEGIDAVPVQYEQLVGSDTHLTKALLGVLTGHESPADMPAWSWDSDAFLDHLSEHLQGGPFATVLEPWLSPCAVSELRALPKIPQHGDFVPNNLGLSRGRLVVFDWEDYGKITLPGFDLFTLMAKSLEFRDAALAGLAGRRIEEVPSWCDVAIRAYCSSVGMTLSLFQRLVPIYLAGFFVLKASYGSGVQEVVRSALQGLAEKWGHDDR